jgi:transposase
MGRAVSITRTELSASELRRSASRSENGRLSCRLLAIAMVLEGASRADAAAAGGMDRQTLRDWVRRYNAEGIAGLSDQPRSGRPPALTPQQMGELKDLVVAGPELQCHGVVRWRCVDLREVIAKRYEVQVHERTVSKLLHRLGLVRLQPRPRHPKQNAEAQAAFKKNSQSWLPNSCHRRRLASRSRSGFRTKPEWARRAR